MDNEKEIEFWINITLYYGWNKIDVMAKGYSGLEGHANITIYYDGPTSNANGPYEGRAGIKNKFSWFSIWWRETV